MAFPPCTAPPGSGGLPFSALAPLPWKGLLMEMLDWVRLSPAGTRGGQQVLFQQEKLLSLRPAG